MEPTTALFDMEDPEFWAEYDKFMREPVDEGVSLQAMKEFIEGEEEDARIV